MDVKQPRIIVQSNHSNTSHHQVLVAVTRRCALTCPVLATIHLRPVLTSLTHIIKNITSHHSITSTPSMIWPVTTSSLVTYFRWDKNISFFKFFTHFTFRWTRALHLNMTLRHQIKIAISIQRRQQLPVTQIIILCTKIQLQHHWILATILQGVPEILATILVSTVNREKWLGINKILSDKHFLLLDTFLLTSIVLC